MCKVFTARRFRAWVPRGTVVIVAEPSNRVASGVGAQLPWYARIWGADAADMPRGVWVLWWAMLVNRIGGFVVPFLALVMAKRGVAVTDASWVLSAYGGGAFVASLGGGWLADRMGRKRTMLASMIAGAVATAGLAVARGLPATILATFAMGACAEAYRPAMSAAMQDLLPVARRRTGSAMLYWAVNAGFAVASLVGGLAINVDQYLLFLVDAGTMLACAAWLAWAFTEPPRRTRLGETAVSPDDIQAATASGVTNAMAASSEASATSTRSPDAVAVANPTVSATSSVAGAQIAVSFVDRWRRHRALWLALPMSFAVGMAMWQNSFALPLDMKAKGFSEFAYGILQALNGAVVIVLQPTVTPHINRYALRTVMAVGTLLFATGFGGYGLANNLAFYAATGVIWSIAEIAVLPGANTYIMHIAPADMRGRYQGALNASWSMAACLSPPIGARLFVWLGTAMWGVIFAVLAVAAMGYWLVIPRKLR